MRAVAAHDSVTDKADCGLVWKQRILQPRPTDWGRMTVPGNSLTSFELAPPASYTYSPL